VAAELVARPGQGIGGDSRPGFPVGQLFLQGCHLLPQLLDLGALLGGHAGRRIHLDAVLGDAGLGLAQGIFLAADVGLALGQFLLQNGQAFLGLPALAFQLGTLELQRGGFLCTQANLLGKFLLLAGQLFGTPAQLLLQGLADLLGLEEGSFAVAQGLAIELQAIVELGELGRTLLQPASFLRLFARLVFEGQDSVTKLLALLHEQVALLVQVGGQLGEPGALFLDLGALLFEVGAFRVQHLAQPMGLLYLACQRGLDLAVLLTLLSQGLLFPLHFLALPLQPRSQRGKLNLLFFEGSGALGQVLRTGLGLGLHQGGLLGGDA